MTKFISIFALLALMALSGLGNFWFTYGIWPRNWITFGIFFFISWILSSMLTIVMKDEK